MIKSVLLTGAQRKELEAIMRRQSEMHGVARRANAVLLLDDGLGFEKIARVLYISEGTVREWHGHYVNGGLDELTMPAITTPKRSKNG